MYIVASAEVFLAYGEYTLALRLTSELVDLRAGYAKRIRLAFADVCVSEVFRPWRRYPRLAFTSELDTLR